MPTFNDFINSFGFIHEFSTCDDRDGIIGFYTYWFEIYKNHLDEWIITRR